MKWRQLKELPVLKEANRLTTYHIVLNDQRDQCKSNLKFVEMNTVQCALVVIYSTSTRRTVKGRCHTLKSRHTPRLEADHKSYQISAKIPMKFSAKNQFQKILHTLQYSSPTLLYCLVRVCAIVNHRSKEKTWVPIVQVLSNPPVTNLANRHGLLAVDHHLNSNPSEAQ